MADHAVRRHIGVAPDREVTTSSMARVNGAATSTSATLRRESDLPADLPPGAVVYLGDVHASQGDTEFTGTAAETRATVRLRLEIKKGTGFRDADREAE